MIFLDSIAKKNYLEILKTFFIALVFLALGSFIGVNFIPYSIRYMLNIAFFILILVSAFTRRGGFVHNKVSMNIYAFILGILTGSTYVYYFYNLGAGTFISIVIGVVLIFGISYLVALNQSEETIFRLGPMITIGILVLLILEFINIFFFKFGTFDLIISAIGIVIYSVYALVIMKSIQSRCKYSILSESEIVTFSFSIFISFLNLLVDLLRFVSILKNDN